MLRNNQRNHLHFMLNFGYKTLIPKNGRPKATEANSPRGNLPGPHNYTYIGQVHQDDLYLLWAVMLLLKVINVLSTFQHHSLNSQLYS